MRQSIVPLFIASVMSAADVMYDGSRVHYESHGTGKDAVVLIHGWTCEALAKFWSADIHSDTRGA